VDVQNGHQLGNEGTMKQFRIISREGLSPGRRVGKSGSDLAIRSRTLAVLRRSGRLA
jgi:hypothetical protein